MLDTMDRWKIFEARFGQTVRESDAVWCRSQSPSERFEIVEDLYAMARQAHENAANWTAIEDLAWERTLADRQRFVAAIHRSLETARGRSAVADTG